jgi:Phosphotransferase enzyme family
VTLLWEQPDWRAEAEAWIRARVDVRGEIEQPHVRWWSTVLRVPTADDVAWFKAAHPLHSSEPALTLELARLRPDLLVEVLDVDLERSWMLTRDAGTRLRELIGSHGDLRRWEQVLPSYAELQLAAAPLAERLVAFGVPDERLARVPARFEGLVEDRDVLVVDREDGLSEAQYAELRATVPLVERMCRELAAFGIPETVQHDDLHDGNVFLRDGRYLVFDWGDSCVSHPFHTLVVMLRAAAAMHDVEPADPLLERIRDAYLEPFGAYGGGSELLDAFSLAYRIGTIGRALAWYRSVEAGIPDLDPDDRDSIPYGMKLFLANGPIGTWKP